MDAEKLEKVMKGLECCSIGLYCPDEECPYEKDKEEKQENCIALLARDALEVLKAHEPHIMTITEAFDAEVAWLERYADPGEAVEPIIKPVIIRFYENGYWECVIEQDESAALTLFIDEFGTDFRFWTSRPTDEQRKAVKWDD